MKRFLIGVSCLALSITPVLAASQNTAVGVGVGTATSASSSASQATAIGGGNATASGGAGGAGGSGGAGGGGGRGVGIGVGGAAAGGNVTIQGTNVPTSTTSNLVTSGTSTVKNVPSVFSPGLAAAGLETCLGSVSGGGSFVGTGFSFGSTIPDPGCAARLDARTLWSMGLKKAAIARLCLGSDIQRAMPEICAEYLPQPAPGYAAGAAAPPAAPTYYYNEGEYHGGPIMLVDGKTNAERLCQNYDAQKHHCRLWDGETHIVTTHSKPKKVAAVKPTTVSSPPAQPEAKPEEKVEGNTK